ncbi:hypothetical protein M1446_03310 [Candidatus Dependentiae bacterium]|nr:hypothetical protein [Candidatus Dependentiae bacterium]
MANYIHPAQLWVASRDKLVAEVKNYLQSIFCNKNCGNTCTICKQIENNQHHSVYWAQPENQYTVEDTQVIIKKMSLQLNVDEKFFIILDKADYLTPLCANSLLKSLEEPPAGYHFILLAQKKDLILPTISSRCLIKILEDNFNIDENILTNFILENIDNFNASKLIKILDDNKFHERDCQEIIDVLILKLKQKYKSELANNNFDSVQKNLNLLQKVTNLSRKLPMPGSNKLFWKNLYLTLCSSKH